MAEPVSRPGRALGAADLGLLVRLTRDLAQAVVRGDLEQALALLQERRLVMQGVVWPEEATPEFWTEVQVMQALEAEVRSLCHTWREIVRHRLTVLSTSHRLLKKYHPPPPPPRFVDVQK